MSRKEDREYLRAALQRAIDRVLDIHEGNTVRRWALVVEVLDGTGDDTSLRYVASRGTAKWEASAMMQRATESRRRRR